MPYRVRNVAGLSPFVLFYQALNRSYFALVISLFRPSIFTFRPRIFLPSGSMETINEGNGDSSTNIPPSTPTLSKNKLKKLKRDQEWEAKRDLRKKIRKQKVQEKKLKKRLAREEAASNAPAALEDHDDKPLVANLGDFKRYRTRATQLPVTIVIDCSFDDFMQDHERNSLSSQVTRCYSDNHKALYQAHLVISSFGGHLKERFDTLLSGNHRSWKGVRFLEEDFTEAARQAKEWMQAPDGGELAGALANVELLPVEKGTDGAKEGEIVYLTSDSPNTLSSLRPYSTYIIGGIVDKNRHKGICYKKAMNAGVKTAKLPIGDYMEMNSRFVLTTNHVSEIMVRWLECGDWRQAFERVMPKRKGGVLKEKGALSKEEANGTTETQQDHEITEDAGEWGKEPVQIPDALNRTEHVLVGHG